jgi:hypothetical protein
MHSFLKFPIDGSQLSESTKILFVYFEDDVLGQGNKSAEVTLLLCVAERLSEVFWSTNFTVPESRIPRTDSGVGGSLLENDKESANITLRNMPTVPLAIYRVLPAVGAITESFQMFTSISMVISPPIRRECVLQLNSIKIR